MKAAIFSPYLDTLGGGEKYLLDISRVLHEKQYECVFFWKDKKITERIVERFGEAYNFVHIDTAWQERNSLSRILKTKEFDLLFFHSDGSYFFSLAKKSFVILQAPTIAILPGKSLWHKLKSFNFHPVYYDNFVKRFFTNHHVNDKQYVLNPAVSDEFFSVPKDNKKRIILSVGRFFEHLHSKKQDVLIKAFNYAQKTYPEFADYTLILAGSSREEDKKYLRYIEKLKGDNSHIEIRTNISFAELSQLYADATFYWHAAGYGEDEQKEPERMEHFGISIIESMAAGCIPLAYNGGGPKETILHVKNGYLYEKKADLVRLTRRLILQPKLRAEFIQKSIERAREKYSFKVFSQNVIRMVE